MPRGAAPLLPLLLLAPPAAEGGFVAPPARRGPPRAGAGGVPAVSMPCSKPDLPDVVDWSATGFVTPVEDEQDAKCGACWAFAAAGALESRWVKQWGQKPVPLSKQQLVDCTKSYGESGCKGGWMTGVFDYAKDHGLCTAASYPYKAAEGTCMQDTCNVSMPQGSVVGYQEVKATEDDLLCAVSEQPVAAAVAGEACPEFKNYTSGIINADHCGTVVDHGVLIVGYDTDVHGVDFWKVKNSWGTGWGEKGYARIARGRTSKNQLGILLHASYPMIANSGAAA